MSEFRCPQTELECQHRHICEPATEIARKLVADAAELSARQQEQYIEAGIIPVPGTAWVLQEMSMKVENGIFVPAGEEEAREKRAKEAPSMEHAASLGELNAHLAIRANLPFPESPERVGAHDEYDQFTQTLCLSGTAEAVREILELPDDEKEQMISRLILEVHSPTSLGEDLS